MADRSRSLRQQLQQMERMAPNSQGEGPAKDLNKALAEGKEIKYLGASGPCKFADNGNVIEVQFRFNQVRDGKIVETKV